MNRVPSKEWLHSYISNSENLYKQGDPYTRKLRAESANPDYQMPPFQETLTPEEIDEVINYLQAN